MELPGSDTNALLGHVVSDPQSSAEINKTTNEIVPDVAQKMGSNKSVQLERNVGLWGGVGIILGIIVGSGIFVSPVGVIRYTGSVGEALLVWFGCGIFSTMGALCYAELGVALPSSGGDYTYIYEIFGPFWGFMRIWIEVIVIRPSAHAIVALTLAEYALQPWFPSRENAPDNAIRLVAILSIAFLTWLNCRSSKWAIHVQNIFTISKILALLIVIGCGVWEMAKGRTKYFQSTVLFEGSQSKPGQISLAIYSGLWAFSGWNELNYVIEEIENPTRNLPLSIVISILTVTVLYLAVNVSYFTILSPAEMIKTTATASVFGEIVLGKYSWIIPLSVALCCFGGINSSLFTSSRLFFVGSRNGHLPSILATINVRRLTPIPSIMFIGILSSIYAIDDNVFALINYSNFVYFFVIGFAILGLIIMRHRNTHQSNAFRVPILIPIISVIVCFGTGVLSFIKAPIESGIGVCILLSSVPAYFILVGSKKIKRFQKISGEEVVQKFGALWLLPL